MQILNFSKHHVLNKYFTNFSDIIDKRVILLQVRL